MEGYKENHSNIKKNNSRSNLARKKNCHQEKLDKKAHSSRLSPIQARDYQNGEHCHQKDWNVAIPVIQSSPVLNRDYPSKSPDPLCLAEGGPGMRPSYVHLSIQDFSVEREGGYLELFIS